MEKFIKAIGAIVIFSGGIIIVAPLGALFGALSGWVTSLLLGQTIGEVLGIFGVHLALWKVGATMGFFGQFLRTKVSGQRKNGE